MITIKKNFPLRKFTSIQIGGPAKFFVTAKNIDDLKEAIRFAKKNKLPWYIAGEGSNLVISDSGFEGVIIKCQLSNIKIKDSLATVGAGYNLLKFIHSLNRRGRSGFERMAGIPGTVGGAVYGCAGAYGQEIKDRLVSVSFFDGKTLRKFMNKQCAFGYRTSIFKKHKNWIITEAVFKLGRGIPTTLRKVSRDTIALRAKKYPPGLKCPGSFFKNLLVKKIKVPLEFKSSIRYGKLPTGLLLERVGAKGMKQGGVSVASHHGNLIYNQGQGTASDVKKLAESLKKLVKSKFGIIIEEEVQYLP